MQQPQNTSAKPPADDNPEVLVYSGGLTISMWRAPDCTATAQEILEAFDWHLGVGGWTANVLQRDFDAGVWVRRDEPSDKGHQIGSMEPQGCHMRLSLNKGTWLSVEEFNAQCDAFRAGITTLFA